MDDSYKFHKKIHIQAIFYCLFVNQLLQMFAGKHDQIKISFKKNKSNFNFHGICEKPVQNQNINEKMRNITFHLSIQDNGFPLQFIKFLIIFTQKEKTFEQNKNGFGQNFPNRRIFSLINF
jgi:hypothetical protein